MMQTFSIRDLREKSGELTREAETGHVSLVTKRGKPVFLTLPFTDQLVGHGTQVALAEHLFKEHIVSLGKAAKIAGMPYSTFAEHVSRMGIPGVDSPAEELADELRVADL